MLKIRWSRDRRICNMVICILVRWHLYIETALNICCELHFLAGGIFILWNYRSMKLPVKLRIWKHINVHQQLFITVTACLYWQQTSLEGRICCIVQHWIGETCAFLHPKPHTYIRSTAPPLPLHLHTKGTISSAHSANSEIAALNPTTFATQNEFPRLLVYRVRSIYQRELCFIPWSFSYWRLVSEFPSHITRNLPIAL